MCMSSISASSRHHQMRVCPVCCAAGVDPYDKTAQAPSELVSFTSSFHGRTLGALVLTYKVRPILQLS